MSSSQKKGKKRALPIDHSPTKSSPLATNVGASTNKNKNKRSAVGIASTSRARMNPDEEGAPSSSEEDDSEEEEEIGPAQFVTASSGDAYLLAHHSSSKTSDNLLSHHFDEPLTTESYFELLDEYDQSTGEYEWILQDVLDKVKIKFPKWIWEMSEGFNICLYGIGSKIKILNEFAECVRDDGNVVVVNGYDEAVLLADVLTALEAFIQSAWIEEQERVQTSNPKKNESSPTKGKGKAKVGTTETTSTSTPTPILPSSLSAIETRARKFVHALSSAPKEMPDIYLVVHNLDGPNLRLPKAISILALLAAQPRLHLLASVDHLKAGLLFPTAMMYTRPNRSVDVRSFTFLHYEVSTRQPYSIEVHHSGLLSKLLPNSIFPSRENSNDPSHSSIIQSIKHVLASVSDRAKKVFATLALKQIEVWQQVPEELNKINLKPDKNGPCPVCSINLDKFKDSIQETLLYMPDKIDSLLSEFKDHNVVFQSFNKPLSIDPESGQLIEDENEDDDGSEWIWIPLGKEALRTVVEEMDVVL